VSLGLELYAEGFAGGLRLNAWEGGARVAEMLFGGFVVGDRVEAHDRLEREADEILLRGTAAPLVPSETLLQTGVNGDETKAE
jgi:hypothetical protein